VTTLEQSPGEVLVGDAPAFATWTRRVIGALLDSAILSATAFLVEGYLSGIAWWGTSGSGDRPPRGKEVIVALGVLLLVQAFTGATPGKRVVGIRVVHDVTGRPLGVLRTVGRELAHIVDAFCMIGYLRPLWHPRRRTVADSAVGSDVVLGRPGPRAGGVDVWTAAAAVVCTVAVGFSTGGTTSFGGASTYPCDVADGSRVDLYVPPTSSTTRLWVTRAGGPMDDLTATWTFPPGTLPPDGAVLTSTVTADDGSWTVSRETQAAVGPEAADAEGSWTVAIPADDLGHVEDDWTWRADVTPPDGANTVEVCSFTHARG